MELLMIFVIGSIFGSAASAIIYRMPKNISWVAGRSMCPKCKHALAWSDLMPVVSFLVLGGKCRYCKKAISIKYFLLEAGMGAGFAAIGFSIFTFSIWQVLAAVILAAILWVTTIIAVMDWETRLVSDVLVVGWGVLVVILAFGIGGHWLSLVGGAIAGGVVIGGIWAVSRGKWMGFGDVEIAVVMGLWLGWPRILPGLWMAFVTGAIVGCCQLVVGKSKLKSQIAFGPFLVIGSWIGFLFGDKLLKLWGVI